MGEDAGVISRGAQGAEPPLLKFLLILGDQPPKPLALSWLFRVYWPCFQSAMIDQLLTAIWLLRHFLLLNILYQYLTKLSCFHL